MNKSNEIHLIGWLFQLHSIKAQLERKCKKTCSTLQSAFNPSALDTWRIQMHVFVFSAVSYFFSSFHSLHFSLSTLVLIFLLLHLTGDWTPPGVQSKFHTWSGPGNQLENPSSIFTSPLHSISSLSPYTYSPLTCTSSCLSCFFFFPEHHFVLSFLPPPFLN